MASTVQRLDGLIIIDKDNSKAKGIIAWYPFPNLDPRLPDLVLDYAEKGLHVKVNNA